MQCAHDTARVAKASLTRHASMDDPTTRRPSDPPIDCNQTKGNPTDFARIVYNLTHSNPICCNPIHSNPIDCNPTECDTIGSNVIRCKQLDSNAIVCGLINVKLINHSSIECNPIASNPTAIAIRSLPIHSLQINGIAHQSAAVLSSDGLLQLLRLPRSTNPHKTHKCDTSCKARAQECTKVSKEAPGPQRSSRRGGRLSRAPWAGPSWNCLGVLLGSA